jgi:molybdopterin-guanine dinucleotide biosynthesis protein A
MKRSGLHESLMTNDMYALILAGGENKRLPMIKGFLEIDGRRIIDSNVDILELIFDRVLISTNKPEDYCYLGLPMVGDTMRHRGPMTGILSALNIPEISEIFVTACDMPFISSELIQYIVDQWDKKWDAAIPLFDKKPQPLMGIYSKTIAHHMETSIKQGKRSLRSFLEEIHVLYISEKDVRRIDPEGRSFVNINTLADVQYVIGGSA